jgi:hypothetical protein
VTKQLPRLDEAAPAGQYPACGGMPEPVRRARPRDAGPSQGAASHTANRVCRQGPVGSIHGKEDLPVGPSHGAPLPQVGGKHLPDVDRQRHLLQPVALAAHGKGPHPPVDVIEAQVSDLPGAQPQPPHQRKHRLVAQPHGAFIWQRPKQISDLRRAQRLGDRGCGRDCDRAEAVGQGR